MSKWNRTVDLFYYYFLKIAVFLKTLGSNNLD